MRWRYGNEYYDDRWSPWKTWWAWRPTKCVTGRDPNNGVEQEMWVWLETYDYRYKYFSRTGRGKRYERKLREARVSERVRK